MNPSCPAAANGPGRPCGGTGCSLGAALPPVTELASQIGEFGRGERSQDDDFDELDMTSRQLASAHVMCDPRELFKGLGGPG